MHQERASTRVPTCATSTRGKAAATKCADDCLIFEAANRIWGDAYGGKRGLLAARYNDPCGLATLGILMHFLALLGRSIRWDEKKQTIVAPLCRTYKCCTAPKQGDDGWGNSKNTSNVRPDGPAVKSKVPFRLNFV
uniref:Uncharacterized protein n=1 Tax=Romanomermis culicivorax TaxID=13658 RepID=A0A915JZN6_ROMCU